MWLVRYLGLFVNQSKESWELKMWWLQGGNNTLTACPRQVIAFWKCQSCLLPLPPPFPPPKKKWIAILCNFSQVMQWLQETLKTVLRQFGGGGGGGWIEGRHKQGLWQEIQKWWIVLFPSFIFFALFSWPYKLNGHVQN